MFDILADQALLATKTFKKHLSKQSRYWAYWKSKVATKTSKNISQDNHFTGQPRWFIRESVEPSVLLSNYIRLLKKSWLAEIVCIWHIPHICHERHEYTRVNFFLTGVNFYRFNAKNWHFRQILCEKVAFFYRFNAKNWRFSV